MWLTCFKHIEGQLARWLEELNQFNMVIQHRSGAKHSNADGMSRIPDTMPQCNCYEAGKDLNSLPCGGCKYCKHLHQQWGRFEQDVDDMIPLAIRDIKVATTNASSSGEDGDEPDEGACNYMDAYSHTQLRDFQLKDTELRPITSWIEAGADLGEPELFLQSAAIKHMWSCKSQLKLIEGVLHYEWEYATQRRSRLVVPQKLKDEVLRHVHDSKRPCKRRDIRIGLDVALYVKTCAKCSRNKKANRHRRAGLQSYHAGCAGEWTHLDITGPFIQSNGGKRYVLMIVYQFTKWLECHVISEQTAEIIAQVFFEEWVAHFGAPSQVHTDQGLNFDGKLFKSLCNLLEITKTCTTPYRPSSNGQVERYNRTLAQFIRCFLEGKQRDWDTYVPALGMIIRATVNRDTGFTPNMMVLGREVNMPLDIFFGVSSSNLKVSNPPEYVRRLLSTLRETQEGA